MSHLAGSDNVVTCVGSNEANYQPSLTAYFICLFRSLPEKNHTHTHTPERDRERERVVRETDTKADRLRNKQKKKSKIYNTIQN